MANNILEMALERLERDFPPSSLSAWFDDATVVSFTDNRLILHSPVQFKKEFIDQKFIEPLQNALYELTGDQIAVVVVTGEYTTPAATSSSPYDDYTFERFIVGSSNKFAHAAALAVAQRPAAENNPLFIYGNSGLGKTHLMYAIANVLRRTHPEFRIIYVKGEDFTNELITAIQEGNVQAFRNKYRMVDLLLLDDVQFIAGKERTQEEFFHTFNALYEAKKQIVLTSDRPPHEMAQLDDRLRTRFEWGLMTDVQPPDLETRIAIIKNKAVQLGFALPDDIASYIATKITANVRQLEGTVKKIKAFHDLEGTVIDHQCVDRAIQDMSRSSEFIITADTIIKEICRYFRLEEDQIRGQSRSRDCVNARQIAMYLIRRMTSLSLSETGGEFSNRDHTTVLHSIEQVEKKMKKDPSFAETVKSIITNINSTK